MIPSPAEDFHAIYVDDSTVDLKWNPIVMEDKDAAIDHYEIYFKELKNNSDSGSPFDHESVSKQKTTQTILRQDSEKDHFSNGQY